MGQVQTQVVWLQALCCYPQFNTCSDSCQCVCVFSYQLCQLIRISDLCVVAFAVNPQFSKTFLLTHRNSVIHTLLPGFLNSLSPLVFHIWQTLLLMSSAPCFLGVYSIATGNHQGKPHRRADGATIFRYHQPQVGLRCRLAACNSLLLTPPRIGLFQTFCSQSDFFQRWSPPYPTGWYNNETLLFLPSEWLTSMLPLFEFGWAC